ncbi:DUF4190 domain-containing protein [Mycobacterium hubeiense]|uniref:DUF4190 domain-containing protein n=1 Tax=Mycobacterium hubeiense TaxID=1867256 RepID=UPI000C7F74C0|nr:DUF4190 domain-containing protein [Mycobacterium sp. QGD 101]
MTESDKPEQPPTQQQYQPPPPPPQPYGAYPGSYPPPPPPPYSGYAAPPIAPKNGLGIASLIIAIVSLLFVWSVVLGIIGGIVAVIIGFVARGRVARGEATNGGVAIAGIVLGFLSIVISLVFIAIWVALFNKAGVTDYFDCVSRAGSDQAAIERCADEFRGRIENEYGITIEPTPTP